MTACLCECPYYLCYLVPALVAVNLALFFAIWVGPRGQGGRKVKHYDRALAMLEEEQGEWFVGLVLERELALVLKYYARRGDAYSGEYSEDSSGEYSEDSSDEDGYDDGDDDDYDDEDEDEDEDEYDAESEGEGEGEGDEDDDDNTGRPCVVYGAYRSRGRGHPRAPPPAADFFAPPLDLAGCA